jgi:nicotinate-nucleotide adenylyltransferase
MSRQIGIYSGTFDPVHPGHIAFALETQAAQGLDEVIFLPERTPRAKQQASSLNHRIALLEQAIAGLPNMHVLELASDQFTVSQTLPELREHLGDASITMLAGSDVVHTFPYRWEGLKELLAEVSLAIGMRAGDSQAEVANILRSLEQDYGHPIQHTFILTPEADLASTHIRNGTVNLSRLHPTTVRYIRDHQLYG